MKKIGRERQLFRQGYKTILAIDEVGRGALAGPLVVGGLLFNQAWFKKLETLPIRDSKQLREPQREALWLDIKKLEPVFKLVKVKNTTIDRAGLSKLWHKSVDQLIKRFQPDFVLIDGKTVLKIENYESWVKGDQRLISLGAISIIAKVHRDRLMRRLHQQNQLYGFDQHKGYGTKRHCLALKKFGPCPYHRLSFCHHLLMS